MQVEWGWKKPPDVDVHIYWLCVCVCKLFDLLDVGVLASNESFLCRVLDDCNLFLCTCTWKLHFAATDYSINRSLMSVLYKVNQLVECNIQINPTAEHWPVLRVILFVHCKSWKFLCILLMLLGIIDINLDVCTWSLILFSISCQRWYCFLFYSSWWNLTVSRSCVKTMTDINVLTVLVMPMLLCASYFSFC